MIHMEPTSTYPSFSVSDAGQAAQRALKIYLDYYYWRVKEPSVLNGQC